MKSEYSPSNANSYADRRPKRGAKRHKVIVGVDFGTTFFTVAFGLPDGRKLTLREQLPSIDIISDGWPGDIDNLPIVPTEILYADPLDQNDDRIWFGHEVDIAIENQEVPPTAKHIRLAKLLLHEAEETRLENEKLRTWAKEARRDPFDYVKDNLVFIKRHVDLYFQKHFSWLQDADFKFVIGCPPAWSMGEHQKMADIAAAAGMRPEFMGSEAEALLAVYLAGRDISSLAKGDAIVICDAGGGTVDLVTIVIQSLDPLEMVQACVSEGATCGGIYVDRRMKEVFRKKLAHEDLDDFEEILRNLMKRFVSNTKKRVMGKRDNERDFFFEVRGLRDDSTRGFRQGRLYISCEEMRKIVFDPSVNELKRRVKTQISMSKRVDESIKIKTIALGGGFGGSPYVFDSLQEELAKLGKEAENIDVQKLSNPGGGNIAKGLVLLASDQRLIKQRRARVNYGLLTFEEYDEERFGNSLETEIIFEERFGGCPMLELIDWFLVKGQAMNERFRIERKKRHYGLLPDAEAVREKVFVYEGDLLPENLIDKRYTQLKDLPPGTQEYYLETSIRDYANNKDKYFINESQDSEPDTHYAIDYDFLAKHKDYEIDKIEFSVSLRSKDGQKLRTKSEKLRLDLVATEAEENEATLLGSLSTRGEMEANVPYSDFGRQPLFSQRKRRRVGPASGDEVEERVRGMARRGGRIGRSCRVRAAGFGEN